MFEISWSELLILGLVTLLMVGPKDLPRFLNMLGKQLGVVRRHANEFRAVFDQAMREAELDELQKEVRDLRDGVKSSFDSATRSVDDAKAAMRVDLNTNRAVQPPAKPGLPSETPQDGPPEPAEPSATDASSSPATDATPALAEVSQTDTTKSAG